MNVFHTNEERTAEPGSGLKTNKVNMKIIDGLKLEGDKRGLVQIPDCERNELPEFFKEMGYKVGVEIGVEKSYFTRRLAKAGLHIFGVDPFGYTKDYAHSKGQRGLDRNWDHCVQSTKDVPNIKLIRKTSMEALKDFEDNSIDFVYIDGHHGFKYVTEDIFEWSKKVRPGGMIAGHDYAYTSKAPNDPWVCHVKFVIDAYVAAFRIKKWYLLGSKDKKEGEKRETFRSWMWIKEGEDDFVWKK